MPDILDYQPDFELSSGERSTPLWLRLSAKLTSDLADLRASNDRALDPIQTATLRGQIRCLKAILALGEESPLIVLPDEE